MSNATSNSVQSQLAPSNPPPNSSTASLKANTSATQGQSAAPLLKDLRDDGGNPNKSVFPEASFAKPKSKKGKKGRAGATNYNNDDITSLLDIVEDVEPIGANMWAIVADKFVDWAQANERPPRDRDSLKNKFDKLCNSKKSTGDPSCPGPVRRAKHISRDIQGKIAALVIGDDDDSEEENNDEKSGTESGAKRNDDKVTGSPTDKRRAVGARGLPSKKAKTDDVLVQNVQSMTGFIGVIANSFFSGVDGNGLGGSKGEKLVEEVKADFQNLKEDVHKGIDDTKVMIAGMSSVLQQLMGKLSDKDPTANV